MSLFRDEYNRAFIHVQTAASFLGERNGVCIADIEGSLYSQENSISN